MDMKIKIIRVLQSMFIMLFLIAAIGLDILSKTKTWSYPDYVCVATDISVMETYLLRMGMAAVLGIGFAAAFSVRKKGYVKESYVIGILCAACCLFYFVLRKDWIAYELQQLLIGNYVMFCYGAAWFGKKRFGNLTGSKLYVIFGLSSMMVSKYSFIYSEFIQGRPLILLYMSTVFMIVYAVFFWQDVENGYIQKKRSVSILVILTFVWVFSCGRIRDILCSISVNSPDNWFIYRWNAWKAVFTGNYPDSVLDIPCMVHVPDFHILWLRQAFSDSLCMSYIVVFVLFTGLLWWMLRNNKTQSVLERTLILSILMTNIIGIIAEINLIWGADIGIFVSQNMYQMIPVIWLIFENQEHNGYNCRLLPIVHYPKRRRQK